MRGWVIGFVCGIPIFFLVGPLMYLITANAQAGFNWAALVATGASLLIGYQITQAQNERRAAAFNHKRMYNYDMETIFKKIQLAMASAWKGSECWEPKIIELSEGYLIYTYRWTQKPINEPVRMVGQMEIHCTDATQGLAPRTQAIVRFWTNDVLDLGDFPKNAEVTMARLDDWLPEHEKVQLTAEELARLTKEVGKG